MSIGYAFQQSTADTTDRTVLYSVRIDERGATSVFMGTTDDSGRYMPRAYYSTAEAAMAAADQSVRKFNPHTPLTVVERAFDADSVPFHR